MLNNVPKVQTPPKESPRFLHSNWIYTTRHNTTAQSWFLLFILNILVFSIHPPLRPQCLKSGNSLMDSPMDNHTGPCDLPIRFSCYSCYPSYGNRNNKILSICLRHNTDAVDRKKTTYGSFWDYEDLPRYPLHTSRYGRVPMMKLCFGRMLSSQCRFCIALGI
jgi:hypothetical protein